MKKETEQTLGLTTLALGYLSYIKGQSTQAVVSTAFNQSKEVGLEVYNNLNLEWGKIVTDYLISSGEDVGVLLMAYGIDLLGRRIKYLSDITLIIRVAIPFAGTIIELQQLVGMIDEVFTLSDLLLFGITSIYESLNVNKNWLARHPSDH